MRPAPNIAINLHDTDTCVYSAGDSIRGSTNLVVEKNASIEAVNITLTGKASTQVEKHPFISNKAAYDVGEHRFLRLSQPVSAASVQTQDRARGRQGYTIPFEFIVPESLLPYACQHTSTKNELARDSHLGLPPTLGDISGQTTFINDVASKEVKVSYSIQVQLNLRLPNGTIIHSKKSKPVCIVPETAEAPPLLVEEDDPYVTPSPETYMPSKIPDSRLAATISEQPSWLQCYPHETSESATAEASALVDLQFHPTSPGEQPPNIEAIATGLHSFNFFGAVPFNTIP